MKYAGVNVQCAMFSLTTNRNSGFLFQKSMFLSVFIQTYFTFNINFNMVKINFISTKMFASTACAFPNLCNLNWNTLDFGIILLLGRLLQTWIYKSNWSTKTLLYQPIYLSYKNLESAAVGCNTLLTLAFTVDEFGVMLSSKGLLWQEAVDTLE